MRVVSGIWIFAVGFDVQTEFANFESPFTMVSNEKTVLSLLVVMCFLRGLKLLRIPPYSGAVVESIMDVCIPYNQLLTLLRP